MNPDPKPLQRFVLVTHLPDKDISAAAETIALMQRFAFPCFACTDRSEHFWDDSTRAALGRIQPLRHFSGALTISEALIPWTDEMTPRDISNIWVISMDSHFVKRTEKQFMSLLAWLNSQPEGIKHAYTCKPYSTTPRTLVALSGVEPQFVEDPLLARASGLYEITDFAYASRLGNIPEPHIMPPLAQSAFYAMS